MAFAEFHPRTGARRLRIPAGSSEGGRFRGKTGQGGMILWYGDAVADGMLEAAIAAVREVTHDAAEHARANHPWQNISGDLEDEIFAAEPIIESPNLVKANWGAPSPALYLELGTVHAKAFPFLRPAADATYGRLPVLIQEHAHMR